MISADGVNMIKKLPIILPLLVALGFWLYKVGNFVEVEQHNDRADFNNAVVRVLNDVREEISGSRPFLEQFAQLEQLDESQQRGMWFLLEDMEYDYQSDLDAAKAELQEIASDGGEEEAQYFAAAEQLLNSYSGHADVHNGLADTIRSKTLDNERLMALMASELGALGQSEELAIERFELAQAQYMDGN